jgi:hypothetical protein
MMGIGRFLEMIVRTQYDLLAATRFADHRILKILNHRSPIPMSV